MVRGGHIVKSQEVCFQDKGRTTRRNASPVKNALSNTIKENGDMKVGTPAPASFDDRLKLISSDVKASPNTPHRIQLQDVEEFQSNVPSQEKIISKDVLPPPKARRKLNNNQVQQMNKKNVPSNAQKLTDFFPVRRSVRKTKTTVLEEKQRTLENMLRNKIEDGLEVHNFEGKGRGVVASRDFVKGDFVVEYSGDLIDISEAKRREQMYAKDQNTGCYMYYFRHKGQQHCVDATAETGKLGRLVNHSRNGNLITRAITVDNKPRLIMVAKDSIEKGDELTYDYGDRSKESLQHHPWLAF